MWDAPPLKVLQQALASPSEPVGKRMRAAYFLRQAYENNQNQSVVVETLGQGLLEKEHGSLMRHEFGYVMGQLRDERVRFLPSSVINTSVFWQKWYSFLLITSAFCFD
jgi:hypothetical protein